MDHLQATKLRAVRDFGAFRGTTAAELRAWLRRILLHRLAEHERKESRWPIALPPDCDPADENTRMRLGLEDADDALRYACARLPADYHQVLQLRYWEKLSWSAAGGRLHRSAAAARMLHIRALHALSILF